jgi:hypothetical protein
MTRITKKEARALGLIDGGESKYNNEKVTYKGETFDSQKEFEYFLLLSDREKRGEIENLRRQVEFEIQPEFTDRNGNKIKKIAYMADFVYDDVSEGRRHIVDVKGVRTDVYKLKKKLLAYRGIMIEEV